MDLIQANINNLIHLWQLVSERAYCFYQKEEFSYSEISFSEWPNRLWFHKEVNENNLYEAKEVLSRSPVVLKIPYWERNGNSADEVFSRHGFLSSAKIKGMSTELNNKFNPSGLVNLQQVTHMEDALLWSSLFKQAFNYNISPVLVLLSSNDIHYFIARHNNRPIGTCILFSCESDVVGFHAMGIIPEMRRNGFAEEIIKYLLNQALDQGFRYATLQSSKMGKGLYLKYGFAEDFILKNYELEPASDQRLF